MSSVRNVKKHSRRMPKVSYGRFIHVGLVGPKPRPKGVGDGQTVDIPLPLADDKVPHACGAGRATRGAQLPRPSPQSHPVGSPAGPSRGVMGKPRATGANVAGTGFQETRARGSRGRP